MRASLDRLLTSKRSVQIDPAFDQRDLCLERRSRAARPVTHLVREADHPCSGAFDEGDEGVENLISAIVVGAEDTFRFLRSTQEFLGHRSAHRRDRLARIAAMRVFVLAHDSADSLTALL